MKFYFIVLFVSSEKKSSVLFLAEKSTYSFKPHVLKQGARTMATHCLNQSWLPPGFAGHGALSKQTACTRTQSGARTPGAVCALCKKHVTDVRNQHGGQGGPRRAEPQHEGRGNSLFTRSFANNQKGKESPHN